MSSLQRRITAVIDTTANLITQLRELDRLREQVRKAEKFSHLAEQELRDADTQFQIQQSIRFQKTGMV
jgi:hypothetical protein